MNRVPIRFAGQPDCPFWPECRITGACDRSCAADAPPLPFPKIRAAALAVIGLAILVLFFLAVRSLKP